MLNHFIASNYASAPVAYPIRRLPMPTPLPHSFTFHPEQNTVVQAGVLLRIGKRHYHRARKPNRWWMLQGTTTARAGKQCVCECAANCFRSVGLGFAARINSPSEGATPTTDCLSIIFTVDSAATPACLLIMLPGTFRQALFAVPHKRHPQNPENVMVPRCFCVPRPSKVEKEQLSLRFSQQKKNNIQSQPKRSAETWGR